MKALITGINGFAGSYLAEALINEKKWEISGTIQPGTNLENIKGIQRELQLFEVDLLNKNSLEKVFSAFVPDYIFHLAGASSVKESFDNPLKFVDVNISGSINLLEIIKKNAPQSKVVLVTSGDIYGESLNVENLTDEHARLLPQSPYAVTKAALDMLGKIYAHSANLNLVIARPFSHIGPKQSPIFFIPSVARQLAEIINGGQRSELSLGNLDFYRDFTDVRDVVQAYIKLALDSKKGSAYNICSGRSYFLRNLVDILIKLSNKDIKIKLDPEQLRKADLANMHPDNSKIKNELGWLPKIPIEKTLKDTLDYWLQKVDNSK